MNKQKQTNYLNPSQKGDLQISNNHFTKIIKPSQNNQNEEILADNQKELVLDLTADTFFYRPLNKSFMEEFYI